jgi:glycine cleavage system H protein
VYPKDLKYSETHEYAKVEGNQVTAGITAYAAEQLGDIVFVELPAVGAIVTAGKPFGVVESVKAVSDCFSPVSGKVVKVNTKLNDDPSVVNSDPHVAGWMVVIEMSAPGELNKLMAVEPYEAHCAAGGGHH